jgi:single-strand DNA-binding protein
MRVVVNGRLRQRSYETREGQKRTVYEVEVDDVGPSLRNATAKVMKAERDKPAAAQSGSDPWAAQGSTEAKGSTDEPPF